MTTPQITPTTPQANANQPSKPKKRKVSYIISVAVNIIFLYIANNLIAWQAQFITDKWTQVLGILNISIALNIISYAAFLFYDKRMFYFVSRLVLDIFGIIVAYRLYTVFPFDFNGFFHMGWLNNIFPYVLLLGIAGIIIGLIVRTSRLVAGKNIHY